MDFSIAYLEDNSEVREVICDLLEIKLKVNCLPLAQFSDLVQHSNSLLKTKIAILDLELGPNKPSGVDAFRWLLEKKYTGQVYFLTGHGKTAPALIEAEKKGAVILEKPLTLEDINKHFPKILNRASSDLPL